MKNTRKSIVSNNKIRLEHLVDKFLNENPEYEIADAPYFQDMGYGSEMWTQEVVLIK